MITERGGGSSRLPKPSTEAGRAGLDAIVADPARAVVCVDFDGTLAPIVPRPDDAHPAPGALDALTALTRRVAACAVVTGRAAVDAVRLGGFDQVPGLIVLGHYGLEAWHDGHLDSPEPVSAVEAARERLAHLVATAAEGTHLEDKHHSLVVHTRPAADPAGALAELTPQIDQIAADLGLEIVPGRYVVEVRPPGVDKGFAVRTLAERHGARVVLYAGDDLGDLPAYDAVEQLRAGDVAGLTVASAGDDAPPELAARADLVLDGPLAVVGFLRELAATLEQK